MRCGGAISSLRPRIRFTSVVCLYWYGIVVVFIDANIPHILPTVPQLSVRRTRNLAPCQYMLLDAQAQCTSSINFASSMPRMIPFVVNRSVPRPRTLACSRTKRFCTALLPNSPPCCARLQFQLLKRVVDLADEHGVEFVVAQGTALAALRTIPGAFLPWDRDSDIYYRYNKTRIDAFTAAVRAQGFRLGALRGNRNPTQLVDASVLYNQHADEVGWYRESEFTFYAKELDWRRAEGKTTNSLEVHKIYVDLYGRGNFSVQPSLDAADTEDTLDRVLAALKSTDRATESRMRVRVTAFGEEAHFPVQNCAEIEAYFDSMYRFRRSTNTSRSSIWSPFPPFMPTEQLEFLGYVRMLEGRCFVDDPMAVNMNV